MARAGYSLSENKELLFINEFQALHGLTTNAFGDCSKGQQKERIKETLLADEIFGITPEHGSRIMVVNKNSRNKFPVCDGILYANDNDLFRPLLVSTTGDCPIILLTTKFKEFIGVIHSGWKGTYKNIAGLAIQKVVDFLGVQSANIQAAIFPGIRQCCYKVGKNFENYFPGQVFDERIDLGRIIFEQLKKEEVLPQNILLPNLCSAHELSDNGDFLFHSYRRSKNGQRNLAFISL
jgi:polyphenol oxidase